MVLRKRTCNLPDPPLPLGYRGVDRWDHDVDFYKLIKVLRDVQYPYSILPDHMPEHPDDPRKWQGFAFGYGYINALIHAANSEV